MNNSEKTKDALFYVISLVSLGVYGILTTGIQPLIVGGLVDDLGLSVERAGRVASLELFGVGLGMVLMSIFLARLNLKQTALASIAIAILLNVASFFAQDYTTLVFLRCVTGLAQGVFWSVMAAGLAGTQDPERGFAFFTIGNGLLVLFTVQTITSWVPSFQISWLYGAIAVLGLVPFLLVSSIPHVGAQANQKAAASDLNDNVAEPTRFKIPMIALFALLGQLLCFVGIGSVFVFLERIGAAAGLSGQTIGTAFSIGPLGGISAAFVASWLSTRLGRLPPTIFAMCAFASAVFTLWLGFNAAIYIVCVASIITLWSFSYPYLVGLLVALDEQGRLAIFGAAIQSAGLALGPIAASFLISGDNFDLVLIISVLSFLLALVCLFPALLKTEKSS